MSGPIVLQLLAIAAVLAAGVSIVAWTLRTGISPMPTLPTVRRTLLVALPPPDRVSGTVYELGAGWGTLALALARRYPAAAVVACELSLLPWAVCRLRARLAGQRNLIVRRADLLRQPLGDAALVVCYLAPALMARLRPRLEADLPLGATVVSSTFAVPGWRPSALHRAADLLQSHVYVYEWPAAGQPPSAPVIG